MTDPKAMNLKYIDRKEITYNKEICNVNIREEMPEDADQEKFVTFFDHSLWKKLHENNISIYGLDGAS